MLLQIYFNELKLLKALFFTEAISYSILDLIALKPIQMYNYNICYKA